jgi:hypothetical protein
MCATAWHYRSTFVDYAFDTDKKILHHCLGPAVVITAFFAVLGLVLGHLPRRHGPRFSSAFHVLGYWYFSRKLQISNWMKMQNSRIIFGLATCFRVVTVHHRNCKFAIGG